MRSSFSMKFQPQSGAVTQAMIIRAPWIDLVLDGAKTWEMRKKNTQKRGWIGLIKSGSLEVHGVVKLVDCLPALHVENYNDYFDKHRVPATEVLANEKDLVPWVFVDALRFQKAVPYKHRQGCVTWVNLSEDVTSKIDQQISLL
jgi:ASCH domain